MESEHDTSATTSPEPSKPSPSQKDGQSPDLNLLTPSELDLLMKAELSSRESTWKLFPQVKFIQVD